jgi:hypothetical protein
MIFSNWALKKGEIVTPRWWFSVVQIVWTTQDDPRTSRPMWLGEVLCSISVPVGRPTLQSSITPVMRIARSVILNRDLQPSKRSWRHEAPTAVGHSEPTYGQPTFITNNFSAIQLWHLLARVFQPDLHAHLIQRLHDFDRLRRRQDLAGGHAQGN